MAGINEQNPVSVQTPLTAPPHHDDTEIPLPANGTPPTAADLQDDWGSRFFGLPASLYANVPGAVIKDYTLTAPHIDLTAPTIDFESQLAGVRNGGRQVIGVGTRALSGARSEVLGDGRRILQSVQTLDQMTPSAVRALQLLGAGANAAIAATPSGVATNVQDNVIATNETIAHLIPKAGTFQQTLSRPVAYDDGRGTRMYIPAGAQLVGNNGRVQLIANDAYLTSHGVTVKASKANIDLGGNAGNAAFSNRFYVQSGSTTVDVNNIAAQLGADGSLVSRADSVNVDLPHAKVTVNGASFAAPNAQTLAAGVDQLQVVSGGTTVNAASTAVTQTTNGPASTLAATTNDLAAVQGQTHLSAGTMTLSLSNNKRTGNGALAWNAKNLVFDDGVNHLQASAATIGVSRTNGRTVLGIEGRDINAHLGNQDWTTRGPSSLDLTYDQSGRLSDVTARSQNVSLKDPSTQLGATGSFLHAHLDDKGMLTSVDGGTRQFTMLTPKSAIVINRGVVNLSRDGDAVLLHGHAASGSYTDSRGTFDLNRNGTIDARITKDAVTVSAAASAFTYTGGSTKLALKNGHVDAALGPGVPQEYLKLTADNVVYSGGSHAGQQTIINADDVVASITRDQSGAANMALSGKNVGMVLDGHRVSIADAKQVDIATNAQGQVTHIDATLPGQSTFTSANGDVKIGVTGLTGSYDPDRLRFSFTKGDVSIASLKLAASGSDVSGVVGPNGGRLIAGGAALTLGGSTPITAQGTDLGLGVRTDAQRQIRAVNADIGTGTGTVSGTTVTISDKPGSQIHLGTRFDASGVFREASLVVPNGGQVLLSRGSDQVLLGPQTSRLTQHDGMLTLDSRNFTDGANIGGWLVAGSGQRASVSLDGSSLILNHIDATNIAVRGHGLNLGIDVQKLDNLLAQVSGFSGSITGGMITLTPTANKSQITATVTTRYGRLTVNNAAALQGIALLKPNQARVEAFDPTGRGELKYSWGPLSLVGQDVGLLATYQPYNQLRQMQDHLRGFNGTQVTPNLRIDTDGAFTLMTSPNEGPVRVGATFLAPLVNDPYSQMPPGPDYRMYPAPTDAPGALFQLGLQRNVVRGQPGARRIETQAVGVYGGVTGSSYVSADIRGQAHIAGIPIPFNHFDIPTTPQAGVFVESGPWRAHVGAHVTLGVVNSPYIRDPSKEGIDLGVGYNNGSWSAGVSAAMEQNGHLGVMFRTSIKF